MSKMLDTLEAAKLLAPDSGVIIRHELWHKKCVDRTEETFVLFVMSGVHKRKYASDSLEEVLEKLKRDVERDRGTSHA